MFVLVTLFLPQGVVGLGSRLSRKAQPDPKLVTA
jgi:hypothetical protein